MMPGWANDGEAVGRLLLQDGAQGRKRRSGGVECILEGGGGDIGGSIVNDLWSCPTGLLQFSQQRA